MTVAAAGRRAERQLHRVAIAVTVRVAHEESR
jgi:hypothetical protein